MTAPTKLTALVALGRLAFGAGLIAAPARVASGWLGADAARSAPQVAIRGLGARDVALSAGALSALGDTHQLRRWVLGAAACDLAHPKNACVLRTRYALQMVPPTIAAVSPA